MIKINIGLLSVALTFSSLYSQDFKAHGSKAIAMGGVGVASSRDVFATYYNPALLAKTKSGVDVNINFEVGMQEDGLIRHINALNDYEIKDTLDRIGDNAPDEDGKNAKSNTQEDRDNLTKIQNRLKQINTNDNVAVDSSTDLLFRIDSYAFGLMMSATSLSNIVVDKQRTALITEVEADDSMYYAEYDQSIDTYIVHNSSDIYEEESLEYAIDEEKTYISEKVLMISSIPLSYGHDFHFKNIGELDVGATLKFMQGRYIQKNINLEKKSINIDFNDAVITNTFGIDFGLAFTPDMFSPLTIGFVGKNLNTPTFNTENSSIGLEPMFRLGASYLLFQNELEVAFDIDLTKNKTELTKVERQYAGLGVSYEPVNWFHMRGGMMEDIATNTSGTIYTAGLGLGHPKFMLDISGQYSADTVSYNDGKSLPEYSKINVSITSKW